jgi:putative membrane protein
MLRNLIIRILVRWMANSFGLWLADRLFAGINYDDDIRVIIVAGLVLSVLNAIIKPVLIIFSLPAIVLSLGLFLILINGFTVWLMSKLVDQFTIDGFGPAVLAGIIIGLVNYAVTTLLEDGRILKDNDI